MNRTRPWTVKATPGSSGGAAAGWRTTRRLCRRLTDGYVRVGHGRDYGDVAPLRGTYSGGRSEMFVTVEMTELGYSTAAGPVDVPGLLTCAGPISCRHEQLRAAAALRTKSGPIRTGSSSPGSTVSRSSRMGSRPPDANLSRRIQASRARTVSNQGQYPPQQPYGQPGQGPYGQQPTQWTPQPPATKQPAVVQRALPVVTMETVPGREISAVVGDVVGVVARTRELRPDLRGVNPLDGYVVMLTDSRQDAVARMVEMAVGRRGGCGCGTQVRLQ